MKKVEIALEGCDDTTYIRLEVSDEEMMFLKRLEILSREHSKYSCQPVLSIDAWNGEVDDE